jgi:hypothetical protein
MLHLTSWLLFSTALFSTLEPITRIGSPSSSGKLAAESSALSFNLQRTRALYRKKELENNKNSSSSLSTQFQDRTTQIRTQASNKHRCSSRHLLITLKTLSYDSKAMKSSKTHPMLSKMNWLEFNASNIQH